ncbi:HSP20-like chaperone [Mycena maculata]|uniref:HSP20-like chaperone n=1 Tax=Mycena maculata TaxID=230809 RepID=A0AAD7N7M8_9AGAR|nr:HSP20-like chaperone [Mycena maculata]
MSGSDSAQREAARKYILGVYEAIRVGRLRVADPQSTAGFRPRMEVYNDPDSPTIIATFELPGVKISDLSISVKQGMLLIQGVRNPRYTSDRRHPSLRTYPQAEGGEMDIDTIDTPQASQARDARYFPFQELRYGSFRRALRLPTGVDTSCITASLSDGLLTVSWPRSPVIKQSDQNISMISAEHSAVERPTSSVRAEPQGTATADRYSRGSK